MGGRGLQSGGASSDSGRSGRWASDAAAIGAAPLAPDRPVLCFSAMGSLLMKIQECHGLEERVNVKII